MRQYLEPLAQWLHNLTSDYPYNSYNDFYASCILLVGLLFVIVCVVWLIWVIAYDEIDKRQGTIRIVTGMLIDKHYEGSHEERSTGVRYMPNGMGGMQQTVAPTSRTIPESFIFFVEADKIYKVPVDMQLYYKYPLHVPVTFGVKIGKLSGRELSTHLL